MAGQRQQPAEEEQAGQDAQGVQGDRVGGGEPETDPGRPRARRRRVHRDSSPKTAVSSSNLLGISPVATASGGIDSRVRRTTSAEAAPCWRLACRAYDRASTTAQSDGPITGR